MKCPQCQSGRVYPSRLRNAWERLRQKLTDRQPYRCHACGWRRWADVEFGDPFPDVDPDDLRTGRPAAPLGSTEVDELDPA